MRWSFTDPRKGPCGCLSLPFSGGCRRPWWGGQRPFLGGFCGCCSPASFDVGWRWLRLGWSSSPRGGAPCGCCLPPFLAGTCCSLQGEGGPVGVAGGSVLLRATGGSDGWFFPLFGWALCGQCSPPWLVQACRLPWWGGWSLLSPGRGRRVASPLFCLPRVYCWCRVRGSVPLPAVSAASAVTWLMVWPFPGGSPSRRVGARVWLFWLGRCPSQLSSARGGQERDGGRLGCLSWGGVSRCSRRPCATCWRFAGLTFLWPVGVCAGGPLRA